MKKAIIIIMLVLLSSSVLAETCFTIVNTPMNERHYWKAITYDILQDGSEYLEKTVDVTSNPGLGPGVQYNIRMDKNCFNNYLLSHLETTGMDSGTMFLQKNGDDYQTLTPTINALYTVSRQEQTGQSIHFVSDISTGIIDGINYLQMPSSFTVSGQHTDYNNLKQGLCNPNLRITEQLANIVDKVWDNLDYGTPSCTSYVNIIDCALTTGKGDSSHYSTLATLLARDCGIPTRVVKGISEGLFNGINIEFNENKIHYWIEYYDTEWYTLDVTAGGGTLPTGLEINCGDSLDNDNDGKPDCWDEECTGTIYCQGEYPTTTDFDNSYSTNIDSLPNAYAINQLILGNEHGEVTWTDQNLDLRDTNLDSALKISFNKVEIISSKLNKPCTIILKGLSFTDPAPLLNGQECTACEIEAYTPDGGWLGFTAPGIGTYSSEEASIVEDMNETINITNETILPPLPTTETGTGLTKVKNKITSWWDTYWGWSTPIKIAIPIIIIALFLFIRSKIKKKRYGG